MVSDAPHILSRDFAFKFDRSRNGNLGLVVPEWIDEEEADSLRQRARSLQACLGTGRPDDSTVMFLPGIVRSEPDAPGQRGRGGGSGGGGRKTLDGGERVGGTGMGMELLRRADPAVLLLLRQLRRITIDDRCRGET